MAMDESDQRRVGRRDFFMLSAGVITAISLGDLLGAAISRAADISFPEGKCGDQKGKGVLIAYTSKYGSTGGVADAIGKELCAGGMNADVLLAGNAVNVGSYQAVVIGSPIYMGKWMSEAADFVKENSDILRKVPVVYFLVCMTLSQPTDKKRAEVLSYMEPVLKDVPEVKPLGIGTFAGALNYGNLSWLNRKILKSKGTPEGDFRDWNAIRAWARKPVQAMLVR